jgi:hypothetical protein
MNKNIQKSICDNSGMAQTDDGKELFYGITNTIMSVAVSTLAGLGTALLGFYYYGSQFDPLSLFLIYPLMVGSFTAILVGSGLAAQTERELSKPLREKIHDELERFNDLYEEELS